MFRPVTAAIIGQRNNNIKGRTEMETSAVQLEYKLKILLLQQIVG